MGRDSGVLFEFGLVRELGYLLWLEAPIPTTCKSYNLYTLKPSDASAYSFLYVKCNYYSLGLIEWLIERLILTFCCHRN